MNKIINQLVCYYTLIFLAITIIFFLYRLSASSIRPTEAFLLSFLTWNVGARGIIAFIANWLPPFANEIAKNYGWPIQNSFQREIASSEGAFGLLGILCNWFQGDFWLAVVIGVTFCWFFSELGGILKIIMKRRDPSYNFKRTLYVGMIVDLVSFLFFFFCFMAWRYGY